MWPITLILILLLAAAGFLGVRRRRRRDENLIRRWADEQGYAVLVISGAMPSLGMIFLTLAIGLVWLFAWNFGALSYPVTVQDDEGAQFTLEVTVRPSSGSIEARRM